MKNFRGRINFQFTNDSIMKKLHVLLFSILIAFKSFGGGLDGIGLVCDPSNNKETSYYIWFEKDFMKLIEIEGYKINWAVNEYSYNENGTNEIQLERPFTVNGYDKWQNKIDRETLIMENKGYLWQCSVAYSKEELDKIIYQVIDNAQSINKI